MDVCQVCSRSAITLVGEFPLCMEHLHDWMLSKEGTTAKRLFGLDSQEANKESRTQALVKLYIVRMTGAPPGSVRV